MKQNSSTTGKTLFESKDMNFIRKIAWSFHKTTGLEWEDLFQEAAIAYIQSIKTYSKSKGSLTTYAYKAASNRLKDYSRKEVLYKKRFLAMDPNEITKNFNFLV